MWNSSGKYQTPFFKEKIGENDFKDDKILHIILDFPKTLAYQVGSGSIEIQLEVDTRVAEGWHLQEGKSIQGLQRYQQNLGGRSGPLSG
jgi:hypothetical protein